ncbi:MAG TPA: hypothetical protein VE685_19690 [Thermoanaerobaculia bacterium]|nr:hypothetical protein [Thermoanaerobaculia bacterium]
MTAKRSILLVVSLSLSLGALNAGAITVDSGTQRLIDAAEDLSQAVEVSADLSPLASAGLSHGESTGIAAVLESLLACQDLTDSVASEVRRIRAEGGSPEEITWAESMTNCGNQVAVDLGLLSSLLDTLPPRISSMACSPVNVWPILYYERCGTDTVYLHDYILIVDVGGNDSYFNNAGGSVIDLMRGPASPPALVAAPARGCQTDAELNSGSGNCFLAEAALLDKRGDDTYQRLQTPEADSVCTTDLIVRRLATGGSGVGGVGVLRDEQGNDSYLGKTLALGMGHAGGFGLLRDHAGVDRYSAIRSSVGAGVLVGLGILEEGSGNDLYVPYDPVGGVIDNTGVCRAGNANLFGAGLLGADGFLREYGGSDTYEVTGVVNTLGSGDLAGFGGFHDKSGVDVYNGATGGRGNNACFPTQNGTGAGHFCDSQ